MTIPIIPPTGNEEEEEFSGCSGVDVVKSKVMLDMLTGGIFDVLTG